ncbi:A1 cistron-splicing factor, AAR2 [Dillenia turbinata]|uniref:A1 cistron-splicing factor, AAR2 n=1 Tax=Dillenia turbinata TaxID=194707 RepID=A0AAN8V5G6_9MAGN
MERGRAFWSAPWSIVHSRNQKKTKLERRNETTQDQKREKETKARRKTQMDAETALELVKKGVTLLLLGVPQYTVVGIDTQVVSVGPAFKGIKMIPPGPHFLYYCSSNRAGNEFSPTVGFFIDACPSEVIVRRWDQQEERLVKLSDEEEERYRQAVRSLEFDRYLGQYALNHFGAWKQLSDFITKTVIERIEPIGGEITIACESEILRNIPKTYMEKTLSEQLKTSKFATSIDKSQRGCYYTSIPRVVKHKGVSAQELTSLNLDKTHLLESLIAKEYGGAEDLLLGELQFAFVAFLMGQSLEAFLQWKALISLLLGCTEAVSSDPFHTRSQLFTKFLKVIYYQLKYGLQNDNQQNGISENRASILLDESWLSSDSFLHHLCKDFFPLVLEASVVDGDLLSWVEAAKTLDEMSGMRLWTRKLKALLEDTLGWEFQKNSAVDGIYCEEEDEVNSELCFCRVFLVVFNSFKMYNHLHLLQYAPVVEMLDDADANFASHSSNM